MSFQKIECNIGGKNYCENLLKSVECHRMEWSSSNLEKVSDSQIRLKSDKLSFLASFGFSYFSPLFILPLSKLISTFPALRQRIKL